MSKSTMSKSILLVGHCGPDASMIRSAVRAFLPSAVFTVANTDDKLASLAGQSDLLLINRVLDGDFAQPAGLDVIRRLGEDGKGSRSAIMLVSDIPEAQHEAELLGARPGFGKRALWSEATRSRILAALGVEASPASEA